MVQGFVPDYAPGGPVVESWQKGPPKKAFWTRTKAPLTEGIPIGAFRCVKCGYLEFYANVNFVAK